MFDLMHWLIETINIEKLRKIQKKFTFILQEQHTKGKQNQVLSLYTVYNVNISLYKICKTSQAAQAVKANAKGTTIWEQHMGHNIQVYL